MANVFNSLLLTTGLIGGSMYFAKGAVNVGEIVIDGVFKPTPTMIGHKYIPVIGPKEYASKFAALPCDSLGNINWDKAISLLK